MSDQIDNEQAIETELSEAEIIAHKKKRKTVIFRSVGLILLIAGLIYFTPILVYNLQHESTDDAFIDGTVVPIAAEVKGRVVKLHVNDNQFVKKGDVLLELYSEDYQNNVQEKENNRSALIAQSVEFTHAVDEKKRALAQASANLEAAKADETLAEKELKRYRELLKEALVSQSRYDSVETGWVSSKARKTAAEAAVLEAVASLQAAYARLGTVGARIRESEASLGTARLDLKRTQLVAPVSGRIAKRNVDPGKYVQAGQSLLSIVDASDIWITANFKETQIKKMRPGQHVEIDVDAYPGVAFKGHIDSLQPGTGSVFSLLPPENATGNFVKVIQRVPVKIRIDTSPDPVHPLRPGLSVIPYVDVRTRKEVTK